jgi:molybdenum cofactor synthesis domain-containing protein
VRFGILAVSDRAARGEREDASGPALAGVVEAEGWQVVHRSVVADDADAITSTLRAWCDAGDVDVILTTGGTGFAPRDRTPEATLAVVERLAPGLAEAVRLSGLQSNRHAMLSRGVAGLRGSTLILNLPGSPRGAREGLEAVMAVLPHAVDLMRDSPDSEAGHRPPPRTPRA